MKRPRSSSLSLYAAGMTAWLSLSSCEKQEQAAQAAAPAVEPATPGPTSAPSLTGVARSFAAAHPMETLTPLGGKLGVVTEDVVVAGSKLCVARHLAPDPSFSGVLGHGWLLNWETQLTRGNDGRDAILLDAGGVALFAQDGELLKAEGVGTLALTPEGAVLTRMDGGGDTFDREGRLIERRVGRDAATLRYDTQGRLAEITANDGGSAKFRHDASGRLLEVNASDGSWVRYGYAETQLPVETTALWSFAYDASGRLATLRGTAAGETRFTYDDRGRVTSRSWADGHAERFDYDDAQRSIRHTAANGQIMTSQWSEDRRQLTMTDANGAKVIQEFNATGQIVSITGEKGRASFEYDVLGRLATITGADGAKQSFTYLGTTMLPVSVTGPDGKRELTYDAQQNLIAFEDGSGRVEFGYSKDGRLVSAKMPGGESWKFEFDEKGRRKAVTDARGRATEFRYDESGRLAGESFGDGASLGYEYGADGRLAAITGANGARRSFAHDAAGRLTEETDAEGRRVQFGYDATGRVTAITEPGGAVRRFEYDARGNVTRRVDARGNVVETKYDAAGRPIEVSEPGAGVTRFSYTADGRIAEVTDPLGRTTRYSYDAAGRLATVTSPEGITTRYGYTTDGAVTTIQRGDAPVEETITEGKSTRLLVGGREFLRREPGAEPGSVVEQFASGLRVTLRRATDGELSSYEDSTGGRLGIERGERGMTLTDARGGKTEMQFDTTGQLVKVTGPLGAATQFRRNRVGELLEAVAPTGDAAKFAYDAAGRLTQRHQPGGGVERIEYGPDGLPAAESDAAGGRVTFERDKLGRVVKRTDAKGQACTFTYDEHSRVVSRQRADGLVIHYGYDAAGRLASVDDGQFPIRYEYDAADRLARIEQPVVKRTLDITYDTLGRRVKAVDSTGQETGYAYDEYGRLAILRATPGGEVRFAYDEAGRLKSATYPNGITAAWSYNASSQITGITCRDSAQRDVAAWSYEYDAAGNRTATRAGTATTRYTYDAAGQLLSGDSGNGKATRYEYGPGGNRTRMSSGNTTVASRYDAAGRLVEAGGETFSYDANGNLAERRDAKGATRYEYDADDQLVKVTLPDGKAVEYGYAPTGERVWRKDSAGRVWALWDGMNLTGELDENLKPLAHYVHGDEIDRPQLRVADGAAFCFHADALGSVARLTDAKGAVAVSYDYDAFGNISRSGGEVRNPFTFTGRDWDPAARLYYFRARYYDPVAGRFTGRDPHNGRAAEPLSLNPYLYVSNAPLNYTDPLGTDRIEQITALAQDYRQYYPSQNARDYSRMGAYHPERGVRLFPQAFEGHPARVVGVLAHELTHQQRFNAYLSTLSGSVTDKLTRWNEWMATPGVRASEERFAHVVQARELVRAGLHPNHPEFEPVMRGYASNGGNPDRLRTALLNQVDRGAHETIAAPVRPVVSEPVPHADIRGPNGTRVMGTERPTVGMTRPMPLADTVATPMPEPLAPTVATPVPGPSTSAQVISGARAGAFVAGGVLTGTNLIASAIEGNSPRDIAAEAVVGGAVTLAAGAVIGSVASPFVATGLAIVGTGYGAYATFGRLGDATGVAADRQRAAYEPTEQTLLVMFAKLGELRALRAQIAANVTEMNSAGSAGTAALTEAEAAVAQLPPDAAPLTQARVVAFVSAAQDGAVKKTQAAADAAKVEAGLSSVTQKLDVVDSIASSANPSAPEVENALNLFSGAQALVAEVVKTAGDVNATATALRTAAAEAKSAPAERDAALAKLAPAEQKVGTCTGFIPTIERVQNEMRPKVAQYQSLAGNLLSYASLAASQLANAPKETQGLLARRTAEIQQAVDWKPDAEVAAAAEFAKSAAPRIKALAAKVTASRAFLYKIPSDLTVPSADDEARRATAASTTAQARLATSAALIQKLRSMGDKVVVPSVVNLQGKAAKELLAAAGFTNVTFAPSRRSAVAGDVAGTVEQQSPGAGTQARRDKAVTLTVLTATLNPANNMPATTAKLKVPAGLPGMTEADAIAKVRAIGFNNVAVVSANSPTPDGKGGTVEQHVPAAGEERDASTTVTLYVFPKPGEAIVPGVYALTVSQAKLQIEGAKLTYVLKVSAYQPEKKEQEFTVQDQNPEKGGKLEVGKPVTLYIYPKFGTTPSNGVPDLVGKKLDDAYALIRSAGLKPGGVTVLTLPKGKQDKADTVAQQTPAAGQPIPENKLVSIVAYAPVQRAGGGDKNSDLDMADATRRDPSVLIGKYQGTFQRIEAQGMIGGDNPRFAKNQDMTSQEVTVSITKVGNNWSVSVAPTAVGNSILVSFTGPNMVNGQSIRHESKGPRWHSICEIVYDNGQLSGTHFNEDLGTLKATGKRWFYRAVFKASKVTSKVP